MKQTFKASDKVYKYYGNLLYKKKKDFLKALIDHFEQQLVHCPDPLQDTMLIKVKDKFIRINNGRCCSVGQNPASKISENHRPNFESVDTASSEEANNMELASERNIEVNWHDINNFLVSLPGSPYPGSIQADWGKKFTYNKKDKKLYSGNGQGKGMLINPIPDFLVEGLEFIHMHRETNEFTFYLSRLGVVTCSICQKLIGVIGGEFDISKCTGNPSGWNRKVNR